LETINDNDEVIVEVEVKREWFSGDLIKLDKLTREIVHKIKDEILVSPTVKLVEPGSLPQSEGKAVRVIDKRKKI